MRKKAAVVVVALLALLAGLFFLAWPRPHSLNQAGFDRITEGMTLREVEEVLGRRPGDYTSRRVPALVIDWSMEKSHRMEEWMSDDGLGVVVFDDEDRVVQKVFLPADDWP